MSKSILKGITTALAGAFVLVVLLVALAACDGAFSEDPENREAVTEEESVKEEAPEPPPTESDPVEPDTDSYYDDLAEDVFQITWDSLPQSEQDAICGLWGIDENMVLDQLMAGVESSDPDSKFTREHARAGLEKNC